MEHFFMRQDYYTLIFDNQKQMKLMKDTTIDHVVIEKVFYSRKTVQQFVFNRINGQWVMTSPETWPAFAPRLPHGMIYNIIYGQKYTESNRKIFVIRGIANGMETSLTFKKIGGKWELIKLNM